MSFRLFVFFVLFVAQTTQELETVNDGSPQWLAYRIYIDGVLACSEEDGASVFRARPQAADGTGVSALGIGGLAYVDDVVFSGVFTITYDPKFSDEDSAFFTLSIKDFRYW